MSQAAPSIVESMAQKIAERLRVASAYSDADLLAADFTEEQIRRYGPLAYGYALTYVGTAHVA